MENKLSVVVVKYNEDLSFIKDIENEIFIYDKSGKNPYYLNKLPSEHTVRYNQLPNISREDYGYLYHMMRIVNKSTGSDSTHTCFIQGDPFAHCDNILNVLKRDLDGNVQWLNLYNKMPFLTTGLKGDNYHNLNTEYFLKTLFVEYPDAWLFNPGAQFIVPNELIQMRSIKFWKVLFSLTSYPEAAFIIERIWPLIFDKEIEARW